jgi:threonine synthase
MQPFSARFSCINPECGCTYGLNEIVYNCDRCGQLLEVRHDLGALRSVPAQEWRHRFDSRVGSTHWPYASGVWGKREWVNPHIADENIVSTNEGNSNLFWAQRLGREIGLEDLWIKMCGNAHTGSFKDLGMTVLVSQVKQMIADGADIRAVACASTGDTSAAVACYCAIAGIPAVVLLPRGKISTAQLVQPMANGALTLALRTDFDGCMAVVKQITKNPLIYLANSMNSLRVEGQKTVGMELVREFDWEVPDWIVIPGGNLGNVSALGKGLLEMQQVGLIDRLPRIVCAQAAQANPLYLAYQRGFEHYEPVQAKKTLASAIQIGNPVSIDKAVAILKRFDGIVEQASEQELADAAARADRTGLYTCPHTAVALAVLFKLASAGVISHGQRVVVVSTAHGLKFTGFKTGYHEQQLEGIDCHRANRPEECDPTVDAVLEAIQRKFAL